MPILFNELTYRKMEMFRLIVLCLVLGSCRNSIHSYVENDYKEAIFVARTQDLFGRKDPVYFDHIGIDVNGSYDKTASRFYAKAGGVYWASLGAGARPRSPADYILDLDETLTASAHRGSSGHAGNDTFGRNIMVPMKKMQAINMRSPLSRGLFSNKGLQTSLTIFRLTGLMKQEVFFSVARERSFSGSEGSVLPFPITIVNQGAGYNNKSHQFVAPVDGVYFFSISAAICEDSKYYSTLRRNRLPFCTLERYSSIHNRHDVLSRSVMIKLSKGDKVDVGINGTSRVGTVGGKQTSFSGFLYNPVHSQSVAWSVAKHSSLSTKISRNVTFDETLVNVGGGWEVQNNVFNCPITGVYYITITVGVQAAKPVSVSINVDGNKAATLIRSGTNHDGTDMMSRSVLLHVSKGSVVYLSAEDGSAIHSTKERETTFTGLLLFSHMKNK